MMDKKMEGAHLVEHSIDDDTISKQPEDYNLRKPLENFKDDEPTKVRHEHFASQCDKKNLSYVELTKNTVTENTPSEIGRNSSAKRKNDLQHFDIQDSTSYKQKGKEELNCETSLSFMEKRHLNVEIRRSSLNLDSSHIPTDGECYNKPEGLDIKTHTKKSDLNLNKSVLENVENELQMAFPDKRNGDHNAGKSLLSNEASSNDDIISQMRVQDLVEIRPIENKANADGKTALNYGPQTALEAMLSDLQETDPSTQTEILENDIPFTNSLPELRQRNKKTNSSERKGEQKRKKKKDLDTIEVDETDSVSDIPQIYTCPVCLDVFYNAYTVQPCGHIFCEPCLRRLAKYSQDALKPTTCPVCRNLIDNCIKNKELSGQVEFYMPKDFHRRKGIESNNKYMRHPLPSSVPTPFSPKRQLSRIVSRLERNRLIRRRQRVGAAPVRLDIWRFLSFALAFILLKGMLLMALLCLYYLTVDHGVPHKIMDMSLSGAYGFSRYLMLIVPKIGGFAGMMLIGVMVAVFFKYSKPKGLVWNRPLHYVQRNDL